jgi:cholesterol oxidase
VALGSIGENLLGMPTTAHILGGAPIGKIAKKARLMKTSQCIIMKVCTLLMVRVMPANPGVNPSLTITALAEYAMSKIRRKNQ